MNRNWSKQEEFLEYQRLFNGLIDKHVKKVYNEAKVNG